MIYFAQLPTGAIKIGTSENVESRLESLSRHYKHELALLATMDGDRRTEREIHERFSHLRCGRTEQFKPGPDLMEFIDKPLLVGANPETVESVPGHDREGVKAVRLELDLETHQQLRVVAAQHGKSMASYARELVEQDLAKHRAKGSK